MCVWCIRNNFFRIGSWEFFHNLIWSIAMSVVCKVGPVGPVGPVVGPQTHRLLTRISGFRPFGLGKALVSGPVTTTCVAGQVWQVNQNCARAERTERWWKVIAMAHQLKSQLEYTQKDGTVCHYFPWEISLLGIFLGCVGKWHLVMKDDWNYPAVSSNSWNPGTERMISCRAKEWFPNLLAVSLGGTIPFFAAFGNDHYFGDPQKSKPGTRALTSSPGGSLINT